MNLEPFREDRAGLRVDPLAGGGSVPFDWEGLAVALGEADEIAETDRAREQAADAMRLLLRWILRPLENAPRDSVSEVLSRRLIGLGWAIAPDLVEGRSLADIARQVGCGRAGLSWHAAAAAREFALRGRARQPGATIPSAHSASPTPAQDTGLGITAGRSSP